jgi:hypothetical protein
LGREMGIWMFRVGCLLYAAGALLLSPLSGLLPVDLLVWAHGLGRPEVPHAYLRVVPAEPGRVPVEVWLTVAGLALVVLGLFFRRSGRRPP